MYEFCYDYLSVMHDYLKSKHGENCKALLYGYR